MPNGTYGGVGGRKTKVGQKTYSVFRPTRFILLPKVITGQQYFQKTVVLTLPKKYIFSAEEVYLLWPKKYISCENKVVRPPLTGLTFKQRTFE